MNFDKIKEEEKVEKYRKRSPRLRNLENVELTNDVFIGT